MERNKHIQYLAALGCVSLLGLSSCSNEEYNEPPLTPSLPKDEITFQTSEWRSVDSSKSRALLYEGDNDLLNANKGGGNFTVSAYLNGTNTAYIKDARVWHFDEISKWIFLDNNEEPMTYYWTESNLDFFAYMPDDAYNGKDGYQSKETYVTLGQYSYETGQTFSCNLPESVNSDTEMHEFIYAYETDKHRTTQPVELKFHHPFALINFKVGVDSYRMTINSIQLNGIYLSGTFSTKPEKTILPDVTPDDEYPEKNVLYGEWKPNESAGTKEYTMELGKRIPNQINYNTYLFDHLIVMPQKSDDVTLTLNYNRYNEETQDDDITGQSTTVKLPINWLQGRRYTYVIRIGDNKEEIYFNVEVIENWIENGETDIDVE